MILKLLGLVPAANDATGTRFVGSAARQRTLNQETGRIDHNFNEKNFLFGSFIINRDERTEPTLQSNNLPGFGDRRPAKRYLISSGLYPRLLPYHSRTTSTPASIAYASTSCRLSPATPPITE